MIVALIDNGSLQPAAHRQLRSRAAVLARRTDVRVHAVSWKHSDRIQPAVLAGFEPPHPTVPLQPDGRAWTLEPWVRAQFAAGERDFLFVPFFISTQGAIGSALRDDLAALQRRLGDFAVRFTGGLGQGNALVRIAVSRIRAVIAARGLSRPPVIVVDHGGPSPESGRLRNAVAAQVAAELANETGPLAAASLEGADCAHSQPLFADQLATPGFDRGDIVVAPLFLATGRHAGPRGDLAQIAHAAEDRLLEPPLRCHFAGLVGTHPLVGDVLTDALRAALSSPPARSASACRSAPATREPTFLPAFDPGVQRTPLSA